MRSSWAIHPQLELCLQAQRSAYHRYFANEYDRIETTESNQDSLRITATITRDLPAPEPGDIRRTLRFKRFFTYEYVIRGLNSAHVEIYFKDRPLGIVYAKIVTLFLQAQVLEPVAYLKLLERDILFMHAAGASDGDRGYVFPAYGGTGKTTLTLGLMAEGFDILGDDLLLVDASEGTVAPYLRPLHIFTYNVKTLRDANLPLRLRMLIRFKDVLRAVLETVTRQEFLISTRVHAEDIYDDLRTGRRVPISRICFLTKEGEDFALSTDTDLEEIVDRILESADLNDSVYENIVDADGRAAVEKLERTVIARAVGHVSEVRFVNTRRLDFRDLSAFRSELKRDA